VISCGTVNDESLGRRCPPGERVPQGPFDAVLPPHMAERAEEAGARKAALDLPALSVLSVLGGAFIALGAVFFTVALAGAGDSPSGSMRVLAGVAFSLGLVLVVVGGAELFTGNSLIVMAWAARRISARALLRNWAITYVGNFIGAVATAGLVVAAGTYRIEGVGDVALRVAAHKLDLGFGQAVALGILCNGLVCLGVWLTYSARSTADRVLVIVPPITAFVAAGFEHSIANMYFVPFALLLAWSDPAFVGAHGPERISETLTWGRFLVANLLPVTLGNLIGGVGLVGAVYWFVYLRRRWSP
jgi:formate transporter